MIVGMNRKQFDNLLKTYKPIQHGEELWWLVNKVDKLVPKTILEIGVNTGGTLAIWDHLLGEKCYNKGNYLLICIDIKNILKWDARKPYIKFITGDSARKETTDKVKYFLQNRRIDFLFVDGGHLEKQVASDHQIYSKLVRKGGLVAFHDIYNDTCPGVKQFWAKVKGKKDSIKFNQGIGIIEM